MFQTGYYATGYYETDYYQLGTGAIIPPIVTGPITGAPAGAGGGFQPLYEAYEKHRKLRFAVKYNRRFILLLLKAFLEIMEP